MNNEMSLGFYYHSEGFCDLLAHRENRKVSWGNITVTCNTDLKTTTRFHFLTYNFVSARGGKEDGSHETGPKIPVCGPAKCYLDKIQCG